MILLGSLEAHYRLGLFLELTHNFSILSNNYPWSRDTLRSSPVGKVTVVLSPFVYRTRLRCQSTGSAQVGNCFKAVADSRDQYPRAFTALILLIV